MPATPLLRRPPPSEAAAPRTAWRGGGCGGGEWGASPPPLPSRVGRAPCPCAGSLLPAVLVAAALLTQPAFHFAVYNPSCNSAAVVWRARRGARQRERATTLHTNGSSSHHTCACMHDAAYTAARSGSNASNYSSLCVLFALGAWRAWPGAPPAAPPRSLPVPCCRRSLARPLAAHQLLLGALVTNVNPCHCAMSSFRILVTSWCCLKMGLPLQRRGRGRAPGGRRCGCQRERPVSPPATPPPPPAPAPPPPLPLMWQAVSHHPT
jgi:hypothetical protein